MLRDILSKGLVRQGRSTVVSPATKVHQTGFPILDQYIGGGWPEGGVIEVLCDRPGCGEVSLFTPLLSACARPEKWCVWISPPLQLYAPGLIEHHVPLSEQLVLSTHNPRDLLWAIEECLRSHAVKVILVWAGDLTVTQIRRLQILSVQNRICCIIFRKKNHENSPSSLRIRVDPASPEKLILEILKRKQGWPVPPFEISVRKVDTWLITATDSRIMCSASSRKRM